MRERVDGLLLLDKPVGLSSNTALQHARRLLNAEKAGHTGTLDPLACGLLPLCFGEATKFSQVVLDARKEYTATLRFGASTMTGDAEGAVTATGAIPDRAEDIAAVLGRFVGRIEQVPPRYAALKHEGRAYYDYARAGIEITRVPREVEVCRLELVSYEAPDAVLCVACSKGTYVRVLGEDIARAMGTVGHLVALRRTSSGAFSLEGAITLEAFEALDPTARRGVLLPPDAAISDLPRIDVDGAAALALEQGRRPATEYAGLARLRAYGPDGAFIGLVEAMSGVLRAIRLVRCKPTTGNAGAELPQL